MLTNAQAAERSLELEKEKTRITAPFDGIVARRYVRVGQKVAISDRLFWVTAVAPLEVKFTLPERFLGKGKERANRSLLSWPTARPRSVTRRPFGRSVRWLILRRNHRDRGPASRPRAGPSAGNAYHHPPP